MQILTGEMAETKLQDIAAQALEDHWKEVFEPVFSQCSMSVDYYGMNVFTSIAVAFATEARNPTVPVAEFIEHYLTSIRSTMEDILSRDNQANNPRPTHPGPGTSQ